MRRRVLGAVVIALLAGGAARTVVAQPKSDATAPSAAPVDINTASEADLVALPQIGKKKAKRIINGRPWARKDDLVEKGILTPGEYAAIKERLVARRP